MRCKDLIGWDIDHTGSCLKSLFSYSLFLCLKGKNQLVKYKMQNTKKGTKYNSLLVFALPMPNR